MKGYATLFGAIVLTRIHKQWLQWRVPHALVWLMLMQPKAARAQTWTAKRAAADQNEKLTAKRKDHLGRTKAQAKTRTRIQCRMSWPARGLPRPLHPCMIDTTHILMDCRKKKRFVWPDLLHAKFVSAVFDVGLRCSSAQTIVRWGLQISRILSCCDSLQAISTPRRSRR